MSSNILFILRHAPYGSGIAREAVDAILAASAYGQNISVLFSGDGVLQLNPQDGQAINSKNLASNLSALPVFDVEQLFACTNALETRGITAPILPIQALTTKDIQSLISRQDCVLSF